MALTKRGKNSGKPSSKRANKGNGGNYGNQSRLSHAPHISEEFSLKGVQIGKAPAPKFEIVRKNGCTSILSM